MQYKINKIIQNNIEKEGALLPILHELQHTLGYIPKESVTDIAKSLNLSRAEVHGVISFYHEFRDKPAGQHTIQICRAEACQAMGSRQLERHATQTLKIDFGQTTDDGKITLEEVFCLGNCACSPSISIDQKVYARVDSAKFDRLIGTLKTTEGKA